MDASGARTVGIWSFAAVAVACGSTQQPETNPPLAESSAQQASAGQTEPPASPPQQAHHVPSAEELGTLPEGVGLEVGTPLPDVVATDFRGGQVSLRALNQDGPLLVVFYRGGWCPYCNFQIRELTEEHAAFARRGVRPILISVDRPEESARTQATYSIPFPVLSDSDLVVHRAFRVTFEVDDATFRRLAAYGTDLERSSGRDHHVIAIPSVFLIGRDGVVKWSHGNRDYTTRPSAAQLLQAIDQHLSP